MILFKRKSDDNGLKQEEPRDDSPSMHFIYGILHHRKAVIFGFVLFTLLCTICIPLVNVNYNITSYLPREAQSTKSLKLMSDAYKSEIPNARLYAKGISLPEATNLAADLKGIDGVEDVLWLGDQADTLQPLEILSKDTTRSWTNGDGFLYQLTIDNGKTSKAIDEIRASALAHNAAEAFMSGDAVTTNSARESTSEEILYILLIAVVTIIIIVSLTSESWFEWVVFLLVLAMAIMMNMGTNIFKGEISFITQICAAVLQLAVSMDYAIVMLHTFRRYEQRYPGDPLKSMAYAMHKGFSVVLSSAAATFFGFLSLCIMSFLIGVDMGIVLAKGILFSFISVMFLMPCIILACLGPLKRFEHRSLLPSFDRFGNRCAKLMIPLSIVICIGVVPAYLAQGKTEFSYGASGMIDEKSETGREAKVIDDAFEASQTWAMIVPEGRWAQEKALINELEALPQVKSVTSYVSVASERIPVEMAPEAQVSQLISKGNSRIIIQTAVDPGNSPGYGLVEDVLKLGEKYYGDESRLAGAQVSEYDLKVTTQADTGRVKLFSMVTIALVLMVMFRSLSIPLIVLIPIEMAIWVNMAVPYFTGQNLNYIGYLVIDAVQLGASVDYAIIFTREYLDQRRLHPPLKAAGAAISGSGIMIMTSALILTIAGLSIHFVASNKIISEIGTLIGRGAFISMLMMFTLLPLLFVLGDWIVRHTSLGTGTFITPAANSRKSRRALQ
ncbi:MAG: MMPL family transporter [Clostridiales Family XIII bacterium]|jgi:predicted RND superfamily exporter protein|nr:MMPL family transporter [Clostridiales Family XIII bacterium]